MSVSPAALGRQQGQGQRQQLVARPFSISEFSRLNLSDTRLSIGDSELAFLENGMILGKHIISVPLYNGAPGVPLSEARVKEAFGLSLTYGAFTTPHPVTIAIFEDGSAMMRDHFQDGAVDSRVAPPGTFTSSPGGTGITVWRDGPVLFLDDEAGYLAWDGTTLNVLDRTKLGHALAVFEGHVFLLTAPRSISYTAPNAYADFTVSAGAGSFQITDDSFIGAVQHLQSTVEQLWILGASAIDALGNVATSGGITTFSVTNALTSLGSRFGDSVIGYFRALTFATGYSIHSLLGVTPQKLSASIDRLFASLSPTITFGPRAGVQQLNGQLVLVFLYTFTDPATLVPRTEVLCYEEGKWFLMTTPDLNGARVLDLVTLTIGSAPEVYGIDSAGRCYRIFARAGDPQRGTMTVASKLFDMGDPTKGHQAIRVGLDLSAPRLTSIVPITLTVLSEAKSVPFSGPVKFNPLLDPLGQRYALMRRNAPIIGQRIGWTLQVPCAYGVTLEAAHLDVILTGEEGWDSVELQTARVLFFNATGQRSHFFNSAGQPVFWLD